MRRIIIIAVLVSMIVGCNSSHIPKGEKLFNVPFESTIELLWCNKKYTGRIERKDVSSMQISLLSEILTSEITYIIKDNSFVMQNDGLEFSMQYKDAPSESAAIVIYELLLLVSQAELSVDKDTTVFSLPKGVITYDNNKDKPIEIEMKDGKLKFIDFKYI